MKNQKLFYFNHKFGLSSDQIANQFSIDKHFNVLAHFTNYRGVKGVAIIEHKRYPFFATLFHPEKVPFIDNEKIMLNKCDHAVNVNMRFARVLTEKLKRSPFNISEQELVNFKRDLVMVTTIETGHEAYVFSLDEQSNSEIMKKLCEKVHN